MRLRALALFALVLCACTLPLQHDLNEQDANEIYVLLETNGITPTKEANKEGTLYNIVVPKADAAAAARLLKEYSLPRARFSGFKGIREGKGMIPTQVEERAMLLESIAGEISNSLNMVDGVLDSHTVVNIPEHSDLSQPDKKPLTSASVFIKYRLNPDGKAPLNELQVKQFVAAAVQDLRPEAVTVIMTPAQLPDVDPGGKGEQQLVDVLGIRVTRATAPQLKAILSVAGILILVLVGFSTWTFMRGSGVQVPRRRRPEGGA